MARELINTFILPVFPHLSGSIILFISEKSAQHDEKRPHLAPRRGAAAHLARPPCAQITTPAAQHWPRRPWPSFCALWPRVPPCSTRRAPSTARHSVTTGRPRRRVVRRHRFPLRKTCHALLRRPRRPSSAATRPPGAVPSRPRPEPRPRAARSTGWACSGRALAARREGRKTSKIRPTGARIYLHFTSRRCRTRGIQCIGPPPYVPERTFGEGFSPPFAGGHFTAPNVRSGQPKAARFTCC